MAGWGVGEVLIGCVCVCVFFFFFFCRAARVRLPSTLLDKCISFKNVKKKKKKNRPQNFVCGIRHFDPPRAFIVMYFC